MAAVSREERPSMPAFSAHSRSGRFSSDLIEESRLRFTGYIGRRAVDDLFLASEFAPVIQHISPRDRLFIGCLAARSQPFAPGRREFFTGAVSLLLIYGHLGGTKYPEFQG